MNVFDEVVALFVLNVQYVIVVPPVYIRYSVVESPSAPSERIDTLAEDPAGNELPEVPVMVIKVLHVSLYALLLQPHEGQSL